MSVIVDERGGATNVEMALLWTAMLTIVLAIVQVALVYFAGQLAMTAAEDGVRAGREYGVNDALGAARRGAFAFLHRAAGTTLDDVAVVARIDDDLVLHVEVTGSAPSLLPGVPLSVRKQAAGGVEQVRP